ncbi:uncharacterized protein DMAD_11271 [Drosophila madeirensis]|uniref:Uncharacterized protein n=1 Tax=Drosophila madeirensis TaxID=30013 RepID=A0AAU9FCN6_DROMD
MPKKPQHLSLASSTASNCGTINAVSSNKPKYSLTLHNSNSKYATGAGSNKNNPLATTTTATTTTLRDNHHQRQHLKALRLTRDAQPAGGDADYKRPTMTGLTGLSPGEDLVGVHHNRTLATMKPLATTAVTGEASTNLTKSMGMGMGMGNGMANGVMRTQNNRLWYH